MIDSDLAARSANKCELCSSTDNLTVFTISPKTDESLESSVVVCGNCNTQLNDSDKIDTNHWYCLNESIWSEHTAVKVLSYRVLSILKNESWALDLRDQMYLEEAEIDWAMHGLSTGNEIVIKDSNGAVLNQGDTVTLIKDLDVKGAGFTAKRGTVVKNISLTDNPNHIEGKVNGVQIVLVTKYLKKQ